MDERPPIPPGFVRIEVMLHIREGLTPGELARVAGVDPEHLGSALVLDGLAMLDVRTEHGKEVRANLEKLGSTQLNRGPAVKAAWCWLRLAVGRNHGLTIGHLRKVLDRAQAGLIGKIHICNTHTLVGVMEDRFESICKALDGKRVNGIPVRPVRPSDEEMRQTPEYTKRR